MEGWLSDSGGQSLGRTGLLAARENYHKVSVFFEPGRWMIGTTKVIVMATTNNPVSASHVARPL